MTCLLLKTLTWQHLAPRSLQALSFTRPCSSKVITYQRDGTLDTLHEIVELTATDTRGGGYQFMRNANILKAMTVFVDRPWWTARNDLGALVGYILGTHIGNGESRTGSLYVHPQYRGSKIAYRLMEHVCQDIISDPRTENFSSNVIPEGKAVLFRIWAKYFPGYADRHTYNIYNGTVTQPGLDKLSTSGSLDPGCTDADDDCDIVKLTRGSLFERLVDWDTAKIHTIPRRYFLRVFLDDNVATTWVALDQSTGNILGYAASQVSFHENCTIIAPVYAEKSTVTFNLMKHMLNGLVDEPIAFTTSAQNELMQMVAKVLKLQLQAEPENVYNVRPLPKVHHPFVFATSSNNITLY